MCRFHKKYEYIPRAEKFYANNNLFYVVLDIDF